MEVYLEWPNMCDDRSSSSSAMITAATAAYSARIQAGIPSNAFDDLSDRMKNTFERYVGDADAPEYFRDSVPAEVRNLGEGAVEKFIKGKDQSHILSKHNHPDQVNDYRNIMWEYSSDNRSRGSQDMSPEEYQRVIDTNAFDARQIVFRDCLDAAETATLWAGLMEAPVAAIENLIYYQRRRKSGQQALADAAKSISIASAGGAAIGFAITGAIAFLGAGPLLMTISPILQPVGIALYGYRTLKRIINAFDDGLPLHRVSNYFCSPRCHTKFAYETGRSALIRWEMSRIHSDSDG